MNRITTVSRYVTEDIDAHRIGFWPDACYDRLFAEDQYPVALAMVEEGWSETKEAKACIQYMQSAECLYSWRGVALCRLCPQYETSLGNKDMITADSKWIFPEGWEHYIIKHSVKPDSEQFIQDAMDFCVVSGSDK